MGIHAFDLTGRSIVVTGGSRGLGRAMALGLAQAGARVLVTGRDADALQQTQYLAGSLPGTIESVELDVRDHSAVDRCAAMAWDAIGPVDAVFANAGVALMKPALETTAEDLTHMYDVNVLGVFNTFRSFAPRMLERGSGKLIAVASDMGIRAADGWVAYSASKAAAISLVKTLAVEWAPTLTVNAIAPGAFHTDLNDHLLSVPEIMAAVAASTPLGRVGDPSELGPLAVYLASSASDYMTGAVVSIDGGTRRS